MLGGGQAAIDRCVGAVLYAGPLPTGASDQLGTTWIAGHNNCGYALFANLSPGTLVTLKGPAVEAHYLVDSNGYVARQGARARA